MICLSALAMNQVLIAMGGSVAFLGILGELSWHLDDYTRDSSSALQQGETEGD
jgi:hypothetical protein